MVGALSGPAPGRARPVIVVFGAAVLRDGRPSRTLERRVAAALRLGATLPGVLYVPTGAAGRYGASEASVMAGLLRAGGAGEVVAEETGMDTLSSVLACAALLRARGEHGTVYAASSAYHLPRCLVLLRLAGVAARACPPPRAPAAEAAGRRWFWRLREVPAVPWDVALLLWGRVREAGRAGR